MEQMPYAGLESLFVGAKGTRRACGCLVSHKKSTSVALMQLSRLIIDLGRDGENVGSRSRKESSSIYKNARGWRMVGCVSAGGAAVPFCVVTGLLSPLAQQKGNGFV